MSARLRSVNPATGEELASYPEHSAEELEAALAAADATQREWATTSFAERRRCLEAAAGCCARDGTPLPAWPPRRWASRSPRRGRARQVRLELRVLRRAGRGVPRRRARPDRRPGQLRGLPAAGRGAGRHALELPLLAGAATLTGSERAGAAVGAAAGRALKKCVLELGGSDPFLVLADADLGLAAEAAARARFLNGGQSCIAAKRFIVTEPVADEFERRLVDAVTALAVGDPLDRSTRVGPLAREDLLTALAGHPGRVMLGPARSWI